MKFNQKEYQSFFDILYNSLKINNNVIISIFLSIIVYAICAILALLGGIFDEYIHTYQIYLFLFGYIWVASWLRWGYNKVFDYLNLIPLNFNGKTGKFLQLKIETQLKKVTNNYYIIISSLLVSILVLTISPDMLGDNILFWPKQLSLHSPFVDYIRLLITFIIINLACFLIGISGFQIVYFLFVILDTISRSISHGLPFVLKEKLRPINHLCIYIFFSWNIGVTLVFLTFFDTLNTKNITLIIILTTISLLVFFIPQIYFSSTLSERKKESLSKIGYVYEKLYNHIDKLKKEELEKTLYIHDLYLKIKKTNTILINPLTFFKVINIYLIPYISLFIKFFYKYLSSKSIE